MCAVSMITDGWGKQFPQVWTTFPPIEPASKYEVEQLRKEFADLKKEIEELKELLKAAKHFDEVTGQLDCQKDEKTDVLRKVAKLLGVDLSDVLPKIKD